MEGDIVAWTPSKIEDINVGDVIVFKSKVNWPDEKILVHRVSGVLENNNREILLETKGDKNKYTDQAGPHIPEPYIRENNLMGKVLSIGQQPLKLPFVGYIGLWINEGLNLISQPTSSKESISYVGIFAPLTISILILVILIF
jgi:signal peptidase I